MCAFIQRSDKASLQLRQCHSLPNSQRISNISLARKMLSRIRFLRSIPCVYPWSSISMSSPNCKKATSNSSWSVTTSITLWNWKEFSGVRIIQPYIAKSQARLFGHIFPIICTIGYFICFTTQLIPAAKSRIAPSDSVMSGLTCTAISPNGVKIVLNVSKRKSLTSRETDSWAFHCSRRAIWSGAYWHYRPIDSFRGLLVLSHYDWQIFALDRGNPSQRYFRANRRKSFLRYGFLVTELV